MADTRKPPEAPGGGPRRKRAAPTIDLKATEVADPARPRSGRRPQPKSSLSQWWPPRHRRPNQRRSLAEPLPPRLSLRRKNRRSLSRKRAAPPPPPPPPPPRGGFGAGLAGGVIGALIVAALGAGLWYGGYIPVVVDATKRCPCAPRGAGKTSAGAEEPAAAQARHRGARQIGRRALAAREQARKRARQPAAHRQGRRATAGRASTAP